MEKDKEAPHKGDRAKNGLQPFNTRISLILDEDFQSDDDHPRLTADSDEASDWEGDDMEDGYTRGDAGMDGSMEIHPLDYPGRYLGATAAGIQEEIDRRELNGLLTLQQANVSRTHPYRAMPGTWPGTGSIPLCRAHRYGLLLPFCRHRPTFFL